MNRAHQAIPGQEIIPLRDDGADLLVSVEPGAATSPDAALVPAIEAAWAAMRHEIPRLFDGPIIQVTSIDAAGNRVAARRGSYKLLSVQRAEPLAISVPTGTMQLSVTAVITGRDTSGRGHVFLGRRSRETRIYGGMWELGPSGGIELPKAPIDRRADAAPFELRRSDVLAALDHETREEIGLELPWDKAIFVCIARDTIACSNDIVAVLDLPDPVDPRRLPCAGRGWEYIDTAWTPIEELRAFDAGHADAIIPPTRALFRFFGWA